MSNLGFVELGLLAISSATTSLCSYDFNSKDLGDSDKVVEDLSPLLLRAVGSGFPGLILAGLVLADAYLPPPQWDNPSNALIPLFRPTAPFKPNSPSLFIKMNTTRLLGYIILIGGTTFRLWAMRTLGRYFTFRLSIRSSHKIIRTGPYGFVRNPAYTGAYLVLLGVILVMSTGKTVTKLAALKAAPFAIPWILASGFVVLVSLPIIRTRVRSEERLLAENFGDDWKAYQREVPYRIFPYVW